MLAAILWVAVPGGVLCFFAGRLRGGGGWVVLPLVLPALLAVGLYWGTYLYRGYDRFEEFLGWMPLILAPAVVVGTLLSFVCYAAGRRRRRSH